jgi:hypothetical protein
MEAVVPAEITAELTQILSNLVLGDNEIRSKYVLSFELFSPLSWRFLAFFVGVGQSNNMLTRLGVFLLVQRRLSTSAWRLRLSSISWPWRNLRSRQILKW